MNAFLQKFSSSNCPTKRHQERAVSSTQSIYSKSTSWKLFLKSVDQDFSIKCLILLCFLWHRLVKLLVEFFMTTMLQLVLLFDQSKSETNYTPLVKFCAGLGARIMFYFLQSLAVFHSCLVWGGTSYEKIDLVLKQVLVS